MHAAEPSALPARGLSSGADLCCDAGGMWGFQWARASINPKQPTRNGPLVAFLPLTGRTHRRHPGSQPRDPQCGPSPIRLTLTLVPPLPSRTTSSVTSHRAPLLQIPLGQPNHRDPKGSRSIAIGCLCPPVCRAFAGHRARCVAWSSARAADTRQAHPGGCRCPAGSESHLSLFMSPSKSSANSETLIQETGGANNHVGCVLSLATVTLSVCRPWQIPGRLVHPSTVLPMYRLLCMYRNPPLLWPSYLNVGKLSPLPACLSSSQHLQGRQQQIDHLKPEPWTHHRCRRGPLSRSLSLLQVPGASTLTPGARTEEHAHGGKRRPGLCQAG